MQKRYIIFILFAFSFTGLFAQSGTSGRIYSDNLEHFNNWRNWYRDTARYNWFFCTTSTFPADKFRINIPLQSTPPDSVWLMINSFVNNRAFEPRIDQRIVSQPFNFTDHSKIFLKFENLFRKGDNDQVLVEVSSDSLQWDAFELYEDLFPLEFPNRRPSPFKVRNPEKVILDLSEFAAGKNKIWLAFHYIKPEFSYGNGWQIDNLELWNTDPHPKCDLAILDDQYGIPQNMYTPISQLEAFPFMASIANRGVANIENVKLEVNIYENKSNTLLFHDEQIIEKMAAGEIKEDLPLGKTFLPQASIPAYRGEYKVSTSVCNENEPLDNSYYFPFLLSDTAFQKENGITNFSNAPAFLNDELAKWEWGNFFYINDGTTVKASSITFGYSIDIGRFLESEKVYVKLYKFINANNNEDAEPAELELLAKNSYTFKSADLNGILTLPLLNIQNSSRGIPLESKTTYFAVVEFDPKYTDSGMRIYANDTLFYQSNRIACKLLNSDRYFSGLKSGNEKSYSLRGFDYPMIPLIRLNLIRTTATNETGKAPDFQFYPNPANQSIHFCNIPERNENWQLKISNVLGQTIYSGKLSEQIDISNLPSGLHSLQFENGSTTITKSLIIEH
ncbi:MAG: T9SS type A sorting domain-containing protein [Saprospiraceae bacterium]